MRKSERKKRKTEKKTAKMKEIMQMTENKKSDLQL